MAGKNVKIGEELRNLGVSAADSPRRNKEIVLSVLFAS